MIDAMVNSEQNSPPASLITMSSDPLRPVTGATQKSWADEDSEDEVTAITNDVQSASLKDRLGPQSAKAKPFIPADNGSKTTSSNGKDEKTNGTKDIEGHENLVKSTQEVKVKLADLQADPESPLYSAKTFEDLPLSEDLLKGLYSMRFKKPSKIQERALPLLLANPPKNMIGQSQSGTGKTAAFVLTMLSRVDVSINAVQAVCIAPSRELARQIMDSVTEMGKFTKVTTKMALKDSISTLR